MTKTIVMWDWDGTIVDSRGAITQALNDLAEHYNQEPVTPTEIANVMSFHKGAFWIRRFAERLDEAFDYFLKQLRIHSQQIILTSDIKTCLDYVQSTGTTQIVASNCPESLLKRECDNVALTSYFERICGTSLTNDSKKPSPDFAKQSLNGLIYDKLVMIGDGASDMLFARNIGATAVYVQSPPFRDTAIPCDIYCPDRTALLETLHQILTERK